MFTKNNSFPRFEHINDESFNEHLLQVRNGNIASFVPMPHHAGAPTYGPDRWLTVSGPGADGSLQNFTIHHAVICESPDLNERLQPALFQLDALQDINGFAKALVNQNDPLTCLLRNRLPELGAWDGSSLLPKALALKIVSELNRLVRKPELLRGVPFVDTAAGSLASELSEITNPSPKQSALLIKSLIEDAYPKQLSANRRLRSAFASESRVGIVLSFGVSRFGFNLPCPLLIVCRPNSCSKELAEAITRGEVTDIRIGGDIIGAVLPVPPAVRPDRPGVVINDERVFSLGFAADTGIKPPMIREELNALTRQLSAEDPDEAARISSYNPFERPRSMGFEIQRRPAMAA